MVRKTISEMEKITLKLETENIELRGNYETLLEQAQQLQGLATNRLVFIRLLEGFANEVNQSLQKLQRDLFELQRGATPEEEEAVGGA
jgi:hypothetical protein